MSEEIGLGVFAAQPIPRGTMVYVKDALEIEIPVSSPLLLSSAYREPIEKYSFIEPDGTRVVSWDIAKYVNHCCQHNTISTSYGFEIAVRDIAAGEEVTDEYGLFNLPYEMCLACTSAPCRRVLRPDDLDVYYADWDEEIIHALAAFRDVPQPLLTLLDETSRSELNQYLDGGEYRSILSLRHRPGRNRLHAL